MGLVRGKPFDGRGLTWADPVIQEILSRITDTAHTLAVWHTDGPDPDLDAARRVVQHALDIEESSEVLYRDLLHIEWAADNTAALHRTIARLQQMADLRHHPRHPHRGHHQPHALRPPRPVTTS